MSILETVITMILVCIFTFLVYLLGYNEAHKRITKGYDKFFKHIFYIAIKEELSLKELHDRIYDYYTGRNPSPTCIAKDCVPNGSEDCIDCGYNVLSKRNMINLEKNIQNL